MRDIANNQPEMALNNEQEAWKIQKKHVILELSFQCYIAVFCCHMISKATKHTIHKWGNHCTAWMRFVSKASKRLVPTRGFVNLESLKKIAEPFLAARRITCFQELIIFREFMTEILGPFAALSNGCQCTDQADCGSSRCGSLWAIITQV